MFSKSRLSIVVGQMNEYMKKWMTGSSFSVAYDQNPTQTEQNVGL